MSSGDSLVDEDLKPLLDNNHNTLADQEDGGDTSGFIVGAGKDSLHPPTAPLSLETAVVEMVSSVETDKPATTTTTVDEPKCCRICGEGEDEQDDDDDDDYYRQHDDEESLLSTPMIPTTTITLQQPPGSGYSQMMNETTNNSDITTNDGMQHHHSEDPPSRPKASITTTKRHRCSNDRKQKKRLRQHNNPLIRPCLCKGTMMYVHVSCLNRWKEVSPRSSSCVACDLCGYEYNIYRPRFAIIVTNPYFLRIMTVFLALLAVVVCAYLCKLVDIYILGHWPRPNNDDWLQLHGAASWLWMDRLYLLAGLMVISMLGMVYLIYLCVTRPEEVRFLNHHSSASGDGLSFYCCDQSSCPWYCFYLADFAVCSGDSIVSGVLNFVVLVSLFTILFGVYGALTGVYQWMEYWVDSIADHIKERILDVD